MRGHNKKAGGICFIGYRMHPWGTSRSEFSLGISVDSGEEEGNGGRWAVALPEFQSDITCYGAPISLTPTDRRRCTSAALPQRTKQQQHKREVKGDVQVSHSLNGSDGSGNGLGID